MKLGKLCILFTDGDWIESKDQSDSGIRLIQTGNIGNGEFLYKNDKAKYISVDTFKRLNCKEVFPNDILVSRLPEPVGRGCIIPDIGEKMITAVDCTICRINENLVDRKYFCYFLESNAYKTQLEQHVTGTTRKRISRKNLSSVEIDIPEQAKQKEVVYKLDRLKKIIQNYNRELDLLDELVRARFVEMFGDPNYNPKGYKKDIIKDHIDLLSGYPFKSENYVDSGINICGGLVIMPQKIKWEECVHWKSAIGYENYLLNNNDIVMALDRPWISEGFKIAKVDSKHLPALLIQRTVRIRSIDMNQDYLYYCFICGGFNKHCNVTGSLVPHISSKDIKSFEVMLPPLELQNQFASFVQEIDKSRLLSNHSLFLIKSLIF